MNMIKKYVLNLLISLDQLLNTILAGDPDETLSSRMGKRLETCKLCAIVCKLLDRIDPRHCHKTIEADEGKDGIFD
jgi:hypothetical protein